MIGDYKVMAIKMLAIDHLSRGVVSDDGNPTHYENRLTADLGKILGLNKDDIRRADACAARGGLICYIYIRMGSRRHMLLSTHQRPQASRLFLEKTPPSFNPHDSHPESRGSMSEDLDEHARNRHGT